MKINNIKNRIFNKILCKRGASHLVAIIAVSLAVVVVVSVFILPRMKQTTEKQFDKTDEQLEEMWDYK